MTELTNYQQWQIERRGDILPEPNLEIGEPGEKEAERFAEWFHLCHERELKEHE